MSGEDEWDLIDRVREGDDRAFEMLMARYKSPVHGFIFRMIGDAAAADDVAQDVFVRMYQQIHKGKLRRGTAALSTWLFQVARRAALDELRRQRRHPAAYAAPGTGHRAAAAGYQHTAAQEIVAREIGEEIAAAVACLPVAQRTALVLAEYEGLPPASIAAVMNCSRKSVETRLYRARLILRQHLAHLLE